MALSNPSKAEAIYATIRRRIVEGAYPPGQPLNPERRLAEEFGVTHVTVRRALARLAEEEMIVKRPHCRSVVRDLPDAAVIGVAVPRYAMSFNEGRHPILEILNAAIASESNPRKHAVNLIHYRPGRFRTDAAQVLAKREARGLLLWPDATLNAGDVQFCIESGMRAMLLGTAPALADVGLPCVTINAETAFTHILRRMLDLGHRRIAVVQHTFQASRGQRERIAVAMLREYGVANPHACFVDVPNDPEKRPDYSEMLARLGAKPAPTAVLVSNEGDAAEVFRHCFRSGVRVPTDLSLAAVGDNAPGIHPVPLTASNTLETHIEAARLAIRELLRLLSGEDLQERSIALPCRVEWKASLGSPPAASKEPGEAQAAG